MKAAIAKKIGMSHIYNEKGNHTPVTLLEVVPNFVVEKKENSVVVGIQTKKRANKPILGLLKKAGIDAVLTKFKQFNGVGELEPFQKGDTVTVSGITKGKGFAGTIKRHGFHRGPASHGSNNIRQPGSIGSQQPQRVVKGRRMSGHMGAEKRTVKNLSIIEVDNNIVAVQGSIPGPNKSWIYVWQQ